VIESTDSSCTPKLCLLNTYNLLVLFNTSAFEPYGLNLLTLDLYALPFLQLWYFGGINYKIIFVTYGAICFFCLGTSIFLWPDKPFQVSTFVNTCAMFLHV